MTVDNHCLKPRAEAADEIRAGYGIAARGERRSRVVAHRPVTPLRELAKDDAAFKRQIAQPLR